MNRATLAAVFLAALGLACTDSPLPVAPGAGRGQVIASTAGPCDPALATSIRSQITALFPKTKSLRQAANSQFDNIVRTCPSADAQAKAISFVQFTTDKFRKHQLTAAASTTTVAHLLNDVLAYVGLGSGIPPSALGSGGAVAVVGPSSSPQVVTTGDGQAGASFPVGALTLPVIVTIAPSGDQTDPLPTGFTQFPPFYDFTTYPAVTFGEPVTIGICVNYGSASQAVLDRLRLARPDAATGGTTIEVLPRVPASFLGCPAVPGLATGPASPANGAGLVARLFAAATALVRPTMLHATSLRLMQFGGVGGLGGTVKNFGDNPTGTVDAAGPDLTVSSLTLTPTTPTAGGLATLIVEVQNIGGAPASVSTLMFNPPLDTIVVSALAPGESFLTSIPRVMIEDGSFAVTARVDPSDQVAELSTTNNEATLNYVVNPGDPVPPLNGSPGTVSPVVDGVLSLNEWANADCLPFLANTSLSSGGDLTPAFLCVMNDANQLYLAVAYRRFIRNGSPSGVPTDVEAQVDVEFDNDGDGLWENGDDDFLFGTDGNFFDNFRTNAPPCSGGAEASCAFQDVDYSGSSDGVGAFRRDERYTVFELAHPLNSGDFTHDFSLGPSSQAGMFLMLSYIISDGAGGLTNVTTLVPGPTFGVFLTVVVE